MSGFVLAFLGGCSLVIDADPGDRPGDASVPDATNSPDRVIPDGSVPDGDVMPLCPGGCDDGIPCTADTCDNGLCVATPQDNLCGPQERCAPTMGCVPIRCTVNAECDDGVFCNGGETCDPGADGADPMTGCTPGVGIECDDGFACTADTCSEAQNQCVSVPNNMACTDGIDCTVDACRPADSNDPTGCVNVEDDMLCAAAFCTVGGVCDAEAGGCVGGRDRDCDDMSDCTVDSCSEGMMMCLNELVDEDGDGAGALSVGGDVCMGGTDCDDENPAVFPGAVEVCNNQDDNCNGVEDEGCITINDTCTDATALMVGAGGATTVNGLFGSYTADIGTICGSGGGRDALYYIDVTNISDIVIDTIGSTADTVLAVGTDCNNFGAFRLGCDNDFDVGVTTESRVFVHRFGPGPGEMSRRLYILVDGVGPGELGAFTLNVSVGRAQTDACPTAIDISGGGSLVGFVNRTAIGITPQTGTCQGIGDIADAESIATFTGPTDGTAEFIAFSNDFDPAVYVRAAPCASGTEVACDDGNGFGGNGYRFRTDLTAMTPSGMQHFVFVDGVTSSGSYFLSYEP
ncbi:MAG: putative metal-binding motif-containing protein [Myxococcota bacterium]